MGYALARVARAQNVGVMGLAREADLADVLYDHYWLEEMERLDDLTREREAIRTAYRVNWAMNAPKELRRESADFHARLWRAPDGGMEPLTDPEKERVADIVASLVGMPAVVS